jgi:hypothetical protein
MMGAEPTACFRRERRDGRSAEGTSLQRISSIFTGKLRNANAGGLGTSAGGSGDTGQTDVGLALGFVQPPLFS